MSLEMNKNKTRSKKACADPCAFETTRRFEATKEDE